MGQQDLCGTFVVVGKSAFPGLDQTHLADCRGRLQFVDGFRTLLPAQPAHAGGNGTG